MLLAGIQSVALLARISFLSSWVVRFTQRIVRASNLTKSKDMDREIPKEVRQRERRKRLMRYGIGIAIIVIAVSVLTSLMRTGVKEKDSVVSTVDQGTIEVSVSASGRVVPAFEEIINSPISTRILEVYKKGGDSVDVGTPLLKLDLQSAETEYRKQLDEEQMREYQLRQLRVNNETKLKDLAMQIKVSEMKLNRMRVELRNEQYLDSLGSGTTDKVRQAELSVNVAQLELEQLRQQYANEQEVLDAEYKVQELELSIFRKSLAETRRTLEDAQVKSPRKAILTDCRHLRRPCGSRRQGRGEDWARAVGRASEQRHAPLEERCHQLRRAIGRSQPSPPAFGTEDGCLCDERRQGRRLAAGQRLLLRRSWRVRTVRTHRCRGVGET